MYSFNSRVRFSETDENKILKLPSVIDYMQDSCLFHSEDVGMGYDYLDKAARRWIITYWDVKINALPHFTDNIKIATWPVSFGSTFGTRNHAIYDEEGNTMIIAQSVWVYMDIQNHRLTKITPDAIENYEVNAPLEGLDYSVRRVVLPDGMTAAKPVTVEQYHIDSNHHVNNGQYIALAAGYLPKGIKIRELRAEYKNSALLGDVMYPYILNTDSSFFLSFKNASGTPYVNIEFMTE